MTSAVYDPAMVHFGIGEINWSSGQEAAIFAMLGDNTGPTKTNAHYSQVTGELTQAGGYTTGGQAFAGLVTAVLASNVCQFDATDAAFAALTKTAYFAHVYHGTLALSTGALITYHDLGGAQAVTNGTLTLQWAATGVFTITISAAA